MALFQNIHPSQVVSLAPVAEAMAAGLIVKMGSEGWEPADDETKAEGVLVVDSVAAPAGQDEMINVYADGVEGAARRIYVGKPGPVDVGTPVCITPNVGPGSSFTAPGNKVYVGSGFLYSSAQNGGDPVGTVLDIEKDGDSVSRLTVKFKFVV